MFPCEMARYIARFRPEARKMGRIWGSRAPKTVVWLLSSAWTEAAPAIFREKARIFDLAQDSSYNLARMRFAIILAPEAVEDLRRLAASARATVSTALETHLRHEPEKVSRSRIKRLRGLRRPQYRLRVDDVRVFYDVVGTRVEILAVVPKVEADSWLDQFGSPE